ncbi:MAG: hypothetical protein JWO05_73 [Gemmatimonadetes bacterium]|nr:hypothetical protein [Gemmatimonadota bacterium]
MKTKYIIMLAALILGPVTVQAQHIEVGRDTRLIAPREPSPSRPPVIVGTLSAVNGDSLIMHSFVPDRYMALHENDYTRIEQMRNRPRWSGARRLGLSVALLGGVVGLAYAERNNATPNDASTCGVAQADCNKPDHSLRGIAIGAVGGFLIGAIVGSRFPGHQWVAVTP